jgi:hypothetical protein
MSAACPVLILILPELREMLAYLARRGSSDATHRELSAGVRKSEKASLCHPIMPIANGIGSGLIHIDHSQLGKRDCQFPALPADEHAGDCIAMV